MEPPGRHGHPRSGAYPRPMDVSVELDIPKVRCAPFHESLAVDPVGSAGAYDAFLVVEVPLPWERDVSKNEPFRSLIEAVGSSTTGPDGRRWRPQAVVPADDAASVRVTAYEQSGDDGRRGPFARREWCVDGADVVELSRALVAGDGEAVAGFADRLEDVAPDVVDLLVCTHGRRDVCCGHLGAELYAELTAARLQEGVRVRRTSHTGGHRFAPTALTFPDGYAWAHLDAAAATALAERRGDPAESLQHCRGSSAVSGGPAQAADREAFARLGWSWPAARRRITVVDFDRTTMATTLHLDGTTPDGARLELRVEVELERHVPQTTCGAIAGPEYSVEPIWRVRSTVVRSD